MIAKLSEMQLFKIPVSSSMSIITLVMIWSMAVTGICRYSRGFVYGWYHTITKHKIYEVFYLFAVYKIQNIQIKVACQNNIFIHCVILGKEILKVVFTSLDISIRGSVDCIKNYLKFLY